MEEKPSLGKNAPWCCSNKKEDSGPLYSGFIFFNYLLFLFFVGLNHWSKARKQAFLPRNSRKYRKSIKRKTIRNYPKPKRTVSHMHKHFLFSLVWNFQSFCGLKTKRHPSSPVFNTCCPAGGAVLEGHETLRKWGLLTGEVAHPPRALRVHSPALPVCPMLPGGGCHMTSCLLLWLEVPFTPGWTTSPQF